MSNNLASMIIFLETSSTQTTAIICGTSFPCFSLNTYYFVLRKHVCHVVPGQPFVLLCPTSLFCTATVGQAEQWSAARRDLVALVGRHPLLNLVMPCVSKSSFHLALGCVLFLSDSNTKWQWLAKWLCCCSFSQQIFNDLNVHHKCPLSCCPRTGYTHMNVSRTQHRAIITWHRLRFLTFVEVWRSCTKTWQWEQGTLSQCCWPG